MAGEWNDKRPMAPHLQVWRWHPAMLASIVHRACSIITYIALIIVAIGLVLFAINGELPLKGLIFSPLGAIGLFIGIFAVTFMVLAAVRHLVWDQGKYLDPDSNNRLSLILIILAVIISAAFVGLISLGGLS